MHVQLAEPLTNNVPWVDSNNPGAIIITFPLSSFSLGFTFLLSKFFREVLCVMGWALSQCTLNVYPKIICFENLSHFFKHDVTVREFFCLFEVRCYEKYALVLVYNTKLLESLSQGDHVWHSDCWRSSTNGNVRLVMVRSFISSTMMVHCVPLICFSFVWTLWSVIDWLLFFVYIK